MTPKISELQRRMKVPFVLNPIKGSAATLLLGPRQTGKSTFIRAQFPEALMIDLLNPSTMHQLASRRERFVQWVKQANREVVVVDEIQKLPELLDDVHWLLENGSWKFVLCASSARKLRREATNLLGGRAYACQFFPLTYTEIPDFDLTRYLQRGGLPSIYLSNDPATQLTNYAQTYFYEEIVAEAVTKNAGISQRFLETVAATHGRQMNYSNIARECGVSHHTVRNYFQILKDTLLGFELEPWRKSTSRRMVETAKFYLFDIGVAQAMAPEPIVPTPGTDAYGRAFEHFILREIQAEYAYERKPLKMRFWRTSAGLEVDLVLGEMRHAIETKAALDWNAKDLKGLRALRQDYPDCAGTLVYRGEEEYQTDDGIRVQPWRSFLARLQAGEI